MSWTRFFRRWYWDEERARELESCLEGETDENMARGMTPALRRKQKDRQHHAGPRINLTHELLRLDQNAFARCREVRLCFFAA
jgi:hypothetical protein